MRERPILFSAPMVRAILAGNKTQTRRAIKLPAQIGDEYGAACWEKAKPPQYAPDIATFVDMAHPTESYPWIVKCPYGVPGDRLWVRETWVEVCAVSPASDAPNEWGDRPFKRIEEPTPSGNRWHYDGRDVVWRADGPVEFCDGDGFSNESADRDDMPRWRPSIHMPRWASRLTLEIESVRVERVQDISEADAVAEGMTREVCAAVFDQASHGVGLRDHHWFYEDESGESYCDQCIDMLAKQRRHKTKTISGIAGMAEESDGPAFCDKCFAPIMMSLTEYGIERELRIEDDKLGKEPHYFPVSGGDARVAQMIADGIGDLRDEHLGRLAQIGYATLWNSIYAKRAFGWDSNPWVWVLKFHVAKEPTCSPTP